MIDINKIAQAVQMIENNILAPVVYMNETEYGIEFICFCCYDVTDDDLFDIGEKLTEILGVPAEVVDIMEYNINDRLDIVKNAELVYSEDSLMEQMLTMSIAEEHKQELEKMKGVLRRKSESGSYYLQ